MLFFYQKCVYIYRQFRSKRRLILNDLVTKYRKKSLMDKKLTNFICLNLIYKLNLIPNKIHRNYEIKNYNLPTKSYNVYIKCFRDGIPCHGIITRMPISWKEEHYSYNIYILTINFKPIDNQDLKKNQDSQLGI